MQGCNSDHHRTRSTSPKQQNTHAPPLPQRTKASRSESGQQQRARLDELETENKLLQKQKTELILAFKKQLALIGVESGSPLVRPVGVVIREVLPA